jgi:hypothetical protein
MSQELRTNNKQPKRRGAPNGNLNALKSGASSKQMQALARELLSNPDLIRSLGGTRQVSNQRLVGAIKTYVVEHQQAKERARQILEPYQSTRMIDRLAEMLRTAPSEGEKA